MFVFEFGPFLGCCQYLKTDAQFVEYDYDLGEGDGLGTLRGWAR